LLICDRFDHRKSPAAAAPAATAAAAIGRSRAMSMTPPDPPLLRLFLRPSLLVPLVRLVPLRLFLAMTSLLEMISLSNRIND
jgi:hypothetical protein